MIKYGRMLISVFTLLKVPHVSSSVDEDTTFRIVLQSLCIGLFILGVVFTSLGDGQSIRQKFPVQQLLAFSMLRYAVSESLCSTMFLAL